MQSRWKEKTSLMINSLTKIYGIFGYPVSQSLSPNMHNAAFRHLELDCVYLAFKVDPSDISVAVDSLRVLGICGVNVTVPHKQSVINSLDEVSPEALMVGAVNTIANENGKLKGYNTDVSGVLRAVKSELDFDPSAANVVIVGAGGSSRAVIVAMCGGGAQSVLIVNRTFSKAQTLVEEFSAQFTNTEFSAVSLSDDEMITEVICKADILVNCSSAGMEGGEPLSLPLSLLKKECVIYDLVYKPTLTPLVKDARVVGLRAESGLGMLLYQGSDAFEIWTGKQAPVEIMRRVLVSEE